MKDRERYENALFTMRFIGEELSEHGVSIYDLSNSLLAWQRIIHKAYLSMEKSLYKGSYPKREIREKLALQIGERRRASDAFALIPILTDPVTQQLAQKVAEYVFDGLIGYYVGDVIERIMKEKDPDKRIFIGSIKAEVVNIVERVDGAGGVTAISIGSPLNNRQTIAAFDEKTKDYIASIKGQYFLGDYIEIKGKVYKLYPVSKIVAIRISKRSVVSIHLNEKDFDEIRYRKESSPEYIFKGRPRYALGVETKTITEFQADDIEYVMKI